MAILTVAAFAEVAPPDPDEVELRAAEELIRLARAGDAGGYDIDYRFTRTRGDERLTFAIRLARTPEARVEIGEGATQINVGDRAWDCISVEDRPSCLEREPGGATAGSSAPYLAAVVSGRYRIAEVGDREIAGHPVRCFALALRGAVPVAGLGTALDVCLDLDGVPLLTRLVGPGTVDERRAEAVRSIDRAQLATLIDTASGGAVALDP